LLVALERRQKASTISASVMRSARLEIMIAATGRPAWSSIGTAIDRTPSSPMRVGSWRARAMQRASSRCA
jgi:hypothetical protein